MSNELLKKCKDWLEGEGYPLEFRVARAWGRSGFKIRQSTYYKDLESGTLRELDILAFYHRTAVDPSSAESFTLTLTFLVECKASKDPWVVLCGETSDRWPMDVVTSQCLVVGDREQRVRDALSLSWWMEAEILAGLRRLGHGVVRAQKGSGQDHAYNAVKQVLSATRARAERIRVAGEVRRCHIVFPVVVFAGPLFEAWLGPSGEVEMEEVKRSFLLLEDEDFSSPPVVLVTEAGIEEFTEAASQTKKLCRLAEELARPASTD